MATFTKLHPEIIQQYLQNFELEKRTLCSSSLGSPLFATAQQLLLRHLDLSADIPLAGGETTFDALISFLARSHIFQHTFRP